MLFASMTVWLGSSCIQTKQFKEKIPSASYKIFQNPPKDLIKTENSWTFSDGYL